MNISEFAKLVRTGDAKFRVTKIILHAEGQKIRGEGLLEIGKDEFELNLVVAPKYPVPDPKREVWKPADAWKLSGLIEGNLKFSCDQVSPIGKQLSWHLGKKVPDIHKLHLHHIELSPAGFDALSKTQRDKLFGGPTAKKPKSPKVEFHAVLAGCEPVLLNAGTTTTV